MKYYLFLTFAAASLYQIELPQTPDLPKLNLGEPLYAAFPIKAQSSLTGGSDTCFLVRLRAQSREFVVRVDTGSSDTVLPGEFLNNYVGPFIRYNAQLGEEQVTSSYGDNSFWRGYQTRVEVGVVGTSIVANCPISVMAAQSTDPIFSSGSFGNKPDGTNGLLGLGFPTLAKETVTPRTVVDAMYSQGQIQRNAIAMHGCPYGPRQSSSWMDIGNETPYDACGGFSITIGIPSPSYYNMNVTSFAVQGVKQPMPADWQPISGVRQVYSILDSCTSNILIPKSMHTALVLEIKRGRGLSPNLRKDANLDLWLSGKIGLSLTALDLDYFNLPSISFTIASQATNFENITLTLGPRQYIQTDSSGKFRKIYLILVLVLVNPWEKNYMILGLPVFSSYFVMADLEAATLTFRPGCGCSRRLDQYPKFFIDEKPVCTCSPFPNFNRTAQNATTTIEPLAANTGTCTCQNSEFKETLLPNRAASNSMPWALALCITILHFL